MFMTELVMGVERSGDGLAGGEVGWREKKMEGKEERKNSREKPYVCEEEGCNRRFQNLQARNEHARWHTGATPYECPVAGCGRKFKWRSSLSSHKRTHANSTSGIGGLGKRKDTAPRRSMGSLGVRSGLSEGTDSGIGLELGGRVKLRKGGSLASPDIHGEGGPLFRGPPLMQMLDDVGSKGLGGPREAAGTEYQYKCEFPQCGKSFRWRSSLSSHKKTHLPSDRGLLSDKVKEIPPMPRPVLPPPSAVRMSGAIDMPTGPGLIGIDHTAGAKRTRLPGTDQLGRSHGVGPQPIGPITGVGTNGVGAVLGVGVGSGATGVVNAAASELSDSMSGGRLLSAGSLRALSNPFPLGTRVSHSSSDEKSSKLENQRLDDRLKRY